MEYRLLSEDILVNLLKTKDEIAFKEIYNRYWQQLYKTALAKVHSSHIAEELVQDVFVKLWEKRAVSSIHHLENYLQTAIKYQVINYLKSFFVREKYLSKMKAECVENKDSASSKILTRELILLINKAIHELPEKTQKIFNLSRLENYSVKEISESMHLSEKAIEYHITKSLKQLKLHLKEFIISIIIFSIANLF